MYELIQYLTIAGLTADVVQKVVTLLKPLFKKKK